MWLSGYFITIQGYISATDTLTQGVPQGPWFISHHFHVQVVELM